MAGIRVALTLRNVVYWEPANNSSLICFHMEDKTPKQKKPVRKLKSASAPIPEGPTGGLLSEMESTCGHTACTGGKCAVRYVGPTTPVRDHHIVHAARHASHIWSAAIVSGLAVVLTGAIGYAAFGAETTNPGGTLYGEFQQINQRLDKIETMVKTLVDRGENQQPAPTNEQAKPAQQANECVTKCNRDYPDSPEKAAQCAKEMCAAPTGEQPAPEQCKTKCQKEYGDNIEKLNACYKENCTQQTQQQPPIDQCTLNCKDKYGSDASAVNSCLAENKCPGYQPAAPTADQCTLNCKTKYKDDQKAINSCLAENKCPGYQAPATSDATKTTCLNKCTANRQICAKEAGTSSTSLRACYSKESECRSACSK